MPPSRGAQFLGIQRAVVVAIGSFEALFYSGEILIFVQRTVVIAVRSAEFLADHVPPQFTPIERAVVITVELVE